jgi:peptidyl-prolyl cis-trans isomerase A (cyclophilin A)
MFGAIPSSIAMLLFGSIAFGWTGTLAQFRTPLGDIDVELFDEDKPVTTENFIRYVKSGRYQDTFIHRWEPRFVIQGGGFFTANRISTDPRIEAVTTFGTITNEYSVGRTLSNLYGTLAMARVSGFTNSASSQWFINLATNSSLDRVDGGFTVFARVVRGFDVLDRFNNASRTNGIFRTNLGGPLNHLPVLSTNVTYGDLVYVDISLLSIRVKTLSNGSRQI